MGQRARTHYAYIPLYARINCLCGVSVISRLFKQPVHALRLPECFRKRGASSIGSESDIGVIFSSARADVSFSRWRSIGECRNGAWSKIRCWAMLCVCVYIFGSRNSLGRTGLLTLRIYSIISDWCFQSRLELTCYI